MHRWLLVVVAAWAVPASAQQVLVNADGRTYLAENGRMIGVRDGTFVATSRGLVELRIEATTIPLDGCVAGDETDESLVGPPEREEGEGVRVIAIAEDGARTVVFEDAPERGPRYYDAVVEQLRVLGPYVLGVASNVSGNCSGLHPDDGGRSFIAFDLESGRPLDLAHDARLTRWIASQRSRARAAFDGADMVEPESSPDLVALVPVFDRSGRLGLDAVYTLFTCYACTDADGESVGDWARYFSAAHVPSRLPAFLRDVSAPTALARAAVVATGVRVSGASSIDPSIAARARGAFTPPT